MNVVERCIMGPSPQACRCFATAVASADGRLCIQRRSRRIDGRDGVKRNRGREREIEWLQLPLE